MEYVAIHTQVTRVADVHILEIVVRESVYILGLNQFHVVAS